MFDHPNLMRMSDLMEPFSPYQFDAVSMVMPRMDTSLHWVVHNRELTEQDIQWITYQILCGLQHMHSAGVTHRDLTLGNIFVNERTNERKYELKIGDFGLSRVCPGSAPHKLKPAREDKDQKEPEKMSDYVTARPYRAPEILMCAENYSDKADIWAAGCVLARMIHKMFLFFGTNSIKQTESIFKVMGSPSADLLNKMKISKVVQAAIADWPVYPPVVDWKKMLCPWSPTPKDTNLSDDLVDLLKKMLTLDPKNRSTAAQLVSHKWFDGVRNKPAYETLFDHKTPNQIKWVEAEWPDTDLNTLKNVNLWRNMFWSMILKYRPHAFSSYIAWFNSEFHS
jgi:serine/threonine protein kinase